MREVNAAALSGAPNDLLDLLWWARTHEVSDSERQAVLWTRAAIAEPRCAVEWVRLLTPTRAEE